MRLYRSQFRALSGESKLLCRCETIYNVQSILMSLSLHQGCCAYELFCPRCGAYSRAALIRINTVCFQYLVCVDSHVPGDSHFPIFYNWQGLMVIPFIITVNPIFPTHLSVYPEGHLVVALPILILGKLLASTDNVPHCFSGFSPQSTQWCL